MYPVNLQIERQDEYNRFLPLVKWLLAIPNLLCLYVVAIVAYLGAFVSFFVVLVTGRYPRGIFDFVVGTMRWSYRLMAYIFLMTDRYPPFALADDPSHPVRFDIPYPEEGVNRWRPLVHWLLILPYYFVASILLYVVYLVVFLAFWVILFTKKFPEGMFNLTLNGMRWMARATAYLGWLVTEYPPFEWDPDEQRKAPPAPPAEVPPPA